MVDFVFSTTYFYTITKSGNLITKEEGLNNSEVFTVRYLLSNYSFNSISI